MLTLVRFAPVTRYVGRERVITNASCRRARRFSVLSLSETRVVCRDRLARMGPDPRGIELSRAIRERVQILDELVRDATPAMWSRVCPGEGWPVGLETYHVGLGLARQGGWIIDRLNGLPVFDFSWEVTNDLNALVARTETWRVKDRVLTYVREQADRFDRLLLRMRAEDWQTDVVTLRESPHDAEWVLRKVALGHIDTHTRSIRAGLEATK
jgi:hypothetical protein